MTYCVRLKPKKKTSAREGLILIDNSPPFSKEMTNQHAIGINNSRPFCKGMTNQHIVSWLAGNLGGAAFGHCFIGRFSSPGFDQPSGGWPVGVQYGYSDVVASAWLSRCGEILLAFRVAVFSKVWNSSTVFSVVFPVFFVFSMASDLLTSCFPKNSPSSKTHSLDDELISDQSTFAHSPSNSLTKGSGMRMTVPGQKKGFKKR